MNFFEPHPLMDKAYRNWYYSMTQRFLRGLANIIGTALAIKLFNIVWELNILVGWQHGSPNTFLSLRVYTRTKQLILFGAGVSCINTELWFFGKNLVNHHASCAGCDMDTARRKQAVKNVLAEVYATVMGKPFPQQEDDEGGTKVSVTPEPPKPGPTREGAMLDWPYELGKA